MSTRHALTIDYVEYVALLEPGTQGTHASGLAFNDDADVLADVPAVHLIGYCHTCAALEPMTRMLGATGHTPELLTAAAIAAGLTCDCA